MTVVGTRAAAWVAAPTGVGAGAARTSRSGPAAAARSGVGIPALAGRSALAEVPALVRAASARPLVRARVSARAGPLTRVATGAALPALLARTLFRIPARTAGSRAGVPDRPGAALSWIALAGAAPSWITLAGAALTRTAVRRVALTRAGSTVPRPRPARTRSSGARATRSGARLPGVGPTGPGTSGRRLVPAGTVGVALGAGASDRAVLPAAVPGVVELGVRSRCQIRAPGPGGRARVVPAVVAPELLPSGAAVLPAAIPRVLPVRSGPVSPGVVPSGARVTGVPSGVVPTARATTGGERVTAAGGAVVEIGQVGPLRCRMLRRARRVGVVPAVAILLAHCRPPSCCVSRPGCGSRCARPRFPSRSPGRSVPPSSSSASTSAR
ncbi:hypothetical protein EV383_0866 [Pseudonocardia sediminis]|uniref:Uncharacterized protein n=1 Tax=Pseudonocardia sediminis TaxID=1397368 RepID=A0A4Q7UVD3_PSEST|nr:hypothetical protein EV383_0866 [Pseudonocardia sediminis]